MPLGTDRAHAHQARQTRASITAGAPAAAERPDHERRRDDEEHRDERADHPGRGRTVPAVRTCRGGRRSGRDPPGRRWRSCPVGGGGSVTFGSDGGRASPAGRGPSPGWLSPSGRDADPSGGGGRRPLGGGRRARGALAGRAVVAGARAGLSGAVGRRGDRGDRGDDRRRPRADGAVDARPPVGGAVAVDHRHRGAPAYVPLTVGDRRGSSAGHEPRGCGTTRSGGSQPS